MTQNLTKYVNKTILVSIPVLSGDVKCRPYKLTGVELVGLWLQSEDLASGFLLDEHKRHAQTTWTFFVPYSQIACVVIGTIAPVQVKPSAQGTAQGVTDESISGQAAVSRRKTQAREK